MAADGKHIPRYCFKYSVAVLAMFGLLQFWQASGDGEIPAFQVLHASSGLDPLRNSHPRCVFADTSDSTRWQALAPALTILAEVNPEVAQWVHQTHQNGKLHFTNRAKICEGSSCQLAKYDAFRRELTIGRGCSPRRTAPLPPSCAMNSGTRGNGFPRPWSTRCLSC